MVTHIKHILNESLTDLEFEIIFKVMSCLENGIAILYRCHKQLSGNLKAVFVKINTVFDAPDFTNRIHVNVSVNSICKVI